MSMYPKQFWNEFRIVDFPKKIFVGMWFDKKNVEKRYYRIIEKAIHKTELEPLFLKDLVTGDSIPIDIMKGIIECKLVLFDISPMSKIFKNRNPNVMYEVGLAHTWRNKEEVILIADDVKSLPFDIQTIGIVQYNPNDDNAIDTIANTIEFRLQEIERIFSAKVIKAYTSLTIDAFNMLMGSKGQVFTITEKDVIENKNPTLYLDALSLLLNLGLIEFLTDAKMDGTGGYGYHPTELGRAVIKYYGFPLLEDNLKEKYPSLHKKKYGISD